MNTWKNRLLIYGGLYTALSIWVPVFWFIAEARRYYQMEVFEWHRMHWSAVLAGLFIGMSSLLAQVWLTRADSSERSDTP